MTMVEAQSSGIKCFISDAVPSQCILTDDVTVLPLSESADYWAEKIAPLSDGYERLDRYNQIADAGFDITQNANWLENFYITEYKKAYDKE